MDQDSALRAYLSANLSALRDDYVRLACEIIPFYRAMPDDLRLEASGAVVRIFVEEALPAWDITPILSLMSRMLRVRASTGLPRDGALAVVSCLRRVFLLRLEAILEVDRGAAPRLMLLLDDFCEAMSAEIRKFYDDILEVTRKALEESEARYRDLVELAPVGVGVYREGRLCYANRAAAEMLGAPAEALMGTEVLEHFPPERRDHVLARMRAAEGATGPGQPAEHVMQRVTGERFTVEIQGTPIIYEGSPARMVLYRDITERKQMEEAVKRAALQEEIIRAQAETLREVSTPLIPVSDGVLVMPLVGHLDRARADQMREVLLSGISAAGAKVAILDVTGVPAMDESVAAALLSAVAAARLLGASVVLTGIKPAAAQALVALGVDFGQVATRATLKDGIAHALARERR